MGSKANIKIKQKAFLKILEKNLGVVTPSCAEFGIDRGTYYDWLKADPEFAQAVESLSDVALDFVEHTMLQRVKEKSDACIIFIMKTRGRKRGYVERQELKVDLSTLTPEQAFAVLAANAAADREGA